MQKPDAELADAFAVIIDSKGFKIEKASVLKIVQLMKERVNFVAELWNESLFFFERPLAYDDQVVKKRWKAETPAQMDALAGMLAELTDFDSISIDTALKNWIEANGYGMGAIMNALRLLLVGAAKGPHLADIMDVIGKEETLLRIQNGISSIQIS